MLLFVFFFFNIKARFISDNFEKASTSVTGHYPSIQLSSMAGFQIKELEFNNLCHLLSGYRKSLPFITTYVLREGNSTLKNKYLAKKHSAIKGFSILGSDTLVAVFNSNIQQQRI